jgi:hypothetical protein
MAQSRNPKVTRIKVTYCDDQGNEKEVDISPQSAFPRAKGGFEEAEQDKAIKDGMLYLATIRGSWSLKDRLKLDVQEDLNKAIAAVKSAKKIIEQL